MIGHPANLDSRHFMLPRDSTEVGPEPLLKAGCDQRAAFLCAENTMVIRTDVGHARIQPSLRDLCNREIAYPTLKGWAILESSLRDEHDGVARGRARSAALCSVVAVTEGSQLDPPGGGYESAYYLGAEAFETAAIFLSN